MSHAAPILLSTLIANGLARSGNRPSFYDALAISKKLPYLPSLKKACPRWVEAKHRFDECGALHQNVSSKAASLSIQMPHFTYREGLNQRKDSTIFWVGWPWIGKKLDYRLLTKVQTIDYRLQTSVSFCEWKIKMLFNAALCSNATSDHTGAESSAPFSKCGT